MKRYLLGTMALLLVLLCVLGMASASTLVIPAGVKTIEAEAFYGDTSIDEVVLPMSIERIGNNAFANSSLRKIYLPDSLLFIGDNALGSNTRAVSVSASKGSKAHEWAIANGFIDPISINSFDRQLFVTANQNVAISITATGNGLRYQWQVMRKGMGQWQNTHRKGSNTAQLEFSATTALSGEYYRCLVTDAQGFIKTSEMTQLIVSPAEKHGNDIAGQISSSIDWRLSNGVLYIEGSGDVPSYYNYTQPWFDYENIITKIVVGEGITSLGAYCFDRCVVKSVLLPSTLESIGLGSFDLCTEMESIILPEGLLSIGTSAFYECYGLRYVVIPSTVQSISDSAFQHCENLTAVKIPKTIKNISSIAFKDSNQQLCIIGEAGSYAEKYAKRNNLQFSNTEVQKEVPSTPLITSITADGNTITIAWQQVYAAESYSIYCKNAKTGAISRVTAKSANPVTIHDLDFSTYYSLWIEAENSIGVGLASSEYTARTRTDKPMITDYTVLEHSISLSWTDIAGVDSYLVYYSEESDFAINESNGVSSRGQTNSLSTIEVYGPKTTISNLSTDRSYHIVVGPVYKGKVGTLSDELSLAPIPQPAHNLINGELEETEYTVHIDEEIAIKGEVQALGTSLQRLSVSINGGDNRALTYLWTKMGTSFADLSDYLVISPSEEGSKFNHVGDYKVSVYAQVFYGDSYISKIGDAIIHVIGSPSQKDDFTNGDHVHVYSGAPIIARSNYCIYDDLYHYIGAFDVYHTCEVCGYESDITTKLMLKTEINDSNAADLLEEHIFIDGVCTICGYNRNTAREEAYYALLKATPTHANPLTIFPDLKNTLIAELTLLTNDSKKATEVVELVQKAPEIYRDLYLWSFYDYSRQLSSKVKKFAYYSSEVNSVMMPLNEPLDTITWFHECGHAIDAALYGQYWSTEKYHDGIFNSMKKVIESDVYAYIAESEKECSIKLSIDDRELIASYILGYNWSMIKEYWWHVIFEKDSKLLPEYKIEPPEEFTKSQKQGFAFAVQKLIDKANKRWSDAIMYGDMLSGFTNNAATLWGHGPMIAERNKRNNASEDEYRLILSEYEYWYKDGKPTYNQNHEGWAEYYAGMIMYGNNSATNINLVDFPDTCLVMHNMAIELLNSYKAKHM